MKSSPKALAAALAWSGAGLLAMALLAGCNQTKSQPELEFRTPYLPEMYRQEAMQAQDLDRFRGNRPDMRVPPRGTVPVGYVPFPQAADLAAIDTMLNPLPVTPKVLASGRHFFDTFCIVCHGPLAHGDGYIVPLMTQPPPLMLPPVTQWSDGRIFLTITNGQGQMPPYRTEMTPAQRWAVVRYLRVLQFAANPSPQALEEEERRAISYAGDAPSKLEPNRTCRACTKLP